MHSDLFKPSTIWGSLNLEKWETTRLEKHTTLNDKKN